MAFTGMKELWWERIFERDREVFTDKDTFDVKTGLILVILFFLAGQSTEFLRSGVTHIEKCLQFFSIASLILGGIFAVFELWPRTFYQEAGTSYIFSMFIGI